MWANKIYDIQSQSQERQVKWSHKRIRFPGGDKNKNQDLES